MKTFKTFRQVSDLAVLKVWVPLCFDLSAALEAESERACKNAADVGFSVEVLLDLRCNCNVLDQNRFTR